MKSVLLLKASSENVHCIFNASLMILLFMDFYTSVTVLQNYINCRGYVAPCERNGGMIMRAVVYFKYTIYTPEGVMNSAKSSVGLLL